ncbi:MAG: hypothetical protein R2786_08985 [Flavobacteriaceae bacterium]
MKAKFLTIILFSFFSMYSAHGQIDIMKALEEGNKQNEEKKDRENPDREKNSNNEKSPSTTKNNEEAENWIKLFNENLAKFGEAKEKFKGDAGCIFLMVVYLNGYFNLVDEVENTPNSNCKKKTDMLTAQATVLAFSTTIMYCPEPLYNKSHEEKEVVWEKQLVPVLLNADHDPLIDDWKQMFKNVTDRFTDSETYQYDGVGIIDNLCLLLSPVHILPTSVDILQEIEALNCGG